jgi:hypothetical protein
MYISPNLKTKKALKEAIKSGKIISVFSPGPFPCPDNGAISVEGPHYPQPHRWYARVLVKDGYVKKVLN